MRLRLAGLVFGVLAAGSAYAQYVISAHSGVIQLVEGSAYLNDKAVQTKFGQFPDIKQGQELRTAEGRAEVLLTPGVFLRMGDNSSIKMVSNVLTDTRVEIESGSVIVECDEIPKDNSIELLYKNNLMMLVKHGLYRFSTEPAAHLQVYDGEAIVKGESGQLTLKSGKETSLSGVLMAENFDKKDTDDLYSWSSRRASYLSTANASSAMSMRDSGGYSGYSGGLLGFGGWQFNPMFGMFTFVPMMGFGYSPFGYGWYSPYTIGYYMPFYGGYYPGYSGYAGGRPASQIASLGNSRGFANSSAPISRGGFSGFGGMARGGGLSSGGGGLSGGAISGGGGHASGMGGGGHAGGGAHR